MPKVFQNIFFFKFFWSFQFFWSFSFLLWSLKSDDCKRNNCFRSMHNFVAKLFQLYLCFEKSTWPNLPKTVFFKSLTSKKHKIVFQESTEFTSWYFFRMWIHQSLPNKACQKRIPKFTSYLTLFMSSNVTTTDHFLPIDFMCLDWFFLFSDLVSSLHSNS